MTKEELEKEAEKHADGIYHYKINVSDYGEDGIINYRYSDVKEAYIKGAEPREKRIVDLESTNKKISDECHKLVNTLEKKQNKNELLETQNIKLQAEVSRLTIKNAELEAQIEKLIDFVLSKTECCDVCPITDTCINSEGTCPYAGILAKGEEEVTREWLMQFISKEIKEK